VGFEIEGSLVKIEIVTKYKFDPYMGPVLDMISVFHHGQNVYESYVNYFNYKTAIYPTFVEGSQTADHKVEENATLRKNAVECFSWGDGTKVLTFPYKLGTAKSLPMREWTYNPDRVKPAPFK